MESSQRSAAGQRAGAGWGFLQGRFQAFSSTGWVASKGKKCDGKAKVEQVNPGLLMRHLLQFHHVCMIKTSGILFLLSELMCKQNR